MNLYDFVENHEYKIDNKIYGVSVGVVTNNKDPEKIGRVKVKLLIRECENETDWVRIATLMAGNSMGTVFIPEVDDEVLVAFIEGDIHQPYIIGFLRNTKDKPQFTNEDGKNNLRTIKSRNGNEIIFNDEDNKESVEIKTKAGQNLKLTDDGNKIEIKDKSGNDYITIDGTKNEVNVSGNNKISLVSKSCTVEIDSNKNSIDIKSGVQINLKAQMINIEADTSIKIKSGGMLMVNGSIVKIN